MKIGRSQSAPFKDVMQEMIDVPLRSIPVEQPCRKAKVDRFYAFIDINLG